MRTRGTSYSPMNRIGTDERGVAVLELVLLVPVFVLLLLASIHRSDSASSG